MVKPTSPQESSYTLEAARRLFPRSREQVLERMKERPGFQIVEKPVPFARDLTTFVLMRGVDLANRIKPYALPYRGFDMNRRGDNLATLPEYGTGFEGYGIGRYTLGEDIVKEIAERGKREIDYLKKMHPGTWRTVMKEVWDAVEGRRITARALDTLNRMLKCTLVDGRQTIQNNRVAQRFRENTQLTVAAAPEVAFYFDETSLCVMNVYQRAIERRSLSGVQIQRLASDPVVLLQSDQALQEGWRLMTKLGMIGQMAVRAADSQGYLNYGPSAMAEAIRHDSGLR